MDILFATTRLRKQCTEDKEMARSFGGQRAKLVRRRLDQLRAAENLGIMRNLPGRCHELTQDRKGQLSIDLDGPYRLIFEPVEEAAPTGADGSLDWSAVTAVRILGVEDTHG